MKKKPYLYIISVVFIFILGNFMCSLPTVPSNVDNSQLDLLTPDESQTQDDIMSNPLSKEIIETRIVQNQFHESVIEPTAGAFEYTATEISYIWEDASGGTWYDLSEDGSDYVAIDLPFSFPFYGE
ncbi:hypothetical protein EU527_13000, partial [Candidatus Thorarchaeota archaeon]